MKTNYRIHYLLHSYRDASAQERLSALLQETGRSIGLICGYAEVLRQDIHAEEFISSAVHELQQGLAENGQRLSNIRESIIANCTDHSQTTDYGEQLDLFRSRTHEPVEALLILAEHARLLKAELQPISPEASRWIDYVVQAIDDTWAVLDALTNSQRELPAYITDWISVRDSLRIKARSGDSQVLGILHPALQNPVPEIRWEAALLLRDCLDTSSVPFLITALRDDDPNVRGQAAETLGMLGDRRAVEPLVECLKYRDSRWGPALALGKLRDPRAVEALCRALEEEMADLNGPPRFLRVIVNLRGALEAIGGPEAESILQRFWPNASW